MAAPVLIERERVERRYGARDVAAALRAVPPADPDDDFDLAAQEASAVAWRILRRGFSAADIIKLCAEDQEVQGALAAIVMDTLAKGHLHLRVKDGPHEGRTVFWTDRAEAVKALEATADGAARTTGEVADDPSGASKLLNFRKRYPKTSVFDGGGF